MDKKEISLEVFPEKNIIAFRIIFANSVIYFIFIIILTYIDNDEVLLFKHLNFLLILSLFKFYITVNGLINNDMFRIFFNLYINLFIFVFTIFIKSIKIIGYIILIPATIIQIFEIIYFYKFYYLNLSNQRKYFFRKLGVSEKLNEAYKVRQKLGVMREILIFRLCYDLVVVVLLPFLDKIELPVNIFKLRYYIFTSTSFK